MRDGAVHYMQIVTQMTQGYLVDRPPGRNVDGALGSELLGAFKGYIEKPMSNHDAGLTTMASPVSIRTARATDASDLAILEDIASFGLASWHWYGGVIDGKAQTAYEHGRQRALDESSETNFRNALLAEIGGSIAGTSISYFIDCGTDYDPSQAPSEYIALFLELRRSLVNAWYIDTLAVFSDYRRRGVARMLLEAELRRGRAANAGTYALIAEDSNKNAMTLYNSAGFEIADKREFTAPDVLQSETKFLFLMTRQA